MAFVGSVSHAGLTVVAKIDEPREMRRTSSEKKKNSFSRLRKTGPPLVSWIWIGALTLIFGTLVALVPSKIKREYAHTQVVGITRKHVVVEK